MSLASFINRFPRRGLWMRIYKPADSDLEKAYEDGVKCATEKSVWFEDGKGKGPGLDRFYYQQKANATRVVDDIERDCAPLIQALSPIFAEYQGVLSRYREADTTLEGIRERCKAAESARAKNQARYEMGDAEAKRDALYEQLEAIRNKAESNGLPDLRNIQGRRLAEAQEHKAYMDHLMSYFLRGAASVLGVEIVSAEQDQKWTRTVLDDYIKTLEGNVGDGRWGMDFSQHLKSQAPLDAVEPELAIGMIA